MPQETLPPAQPSFVLRGHAAQIHALHFTCYNKRLLTADADGWVVSWNVAYKRPVAVWKAHGNAVLGLGSWGLDRIITHGRDNKLLIWQLGEADEGHMEKTLPVDIKDISESTAQKQPWLLHAMPVNSMNFCSFAMCRDEISGSVSSTSVALEKTKLDPILLTVPNALDSSGIDIFQFPSRTRAAVIHKDRDINTGMVMALAIETQSSYIQVAAGYESGHTMVYVQKDPGAVFEKLYIAHTHSQPILSLSISPCKEHYITSSADANISMHPLPLGQNIWKTDYRPLKTVATKHAGQQGLSYRSDGRIFASAGWDSHIRVYSKKTMKEVAALKWHKEGCYATAFASILTTTANGASPKSGVGGNDLSSEGPRNDITPTALAASEDQSNAEDRNKETPSSSNHGTLIPQQEHSPSISVSGSVQQRREEKARTTHWLAAGSKDGKVTLWDIF